jgi:hypothetical protein
MRRALVNSFDELVARPLRDGVNAACWPRSLAGDFAEVARLLAPQEGLVDVDAALLASLSLSAAGRAAADLMRDDLARLDALGREPVLNCITSYPRDERGLAIATDVMSFHADSAPHEIDTWLCTYCGKPSEGLDNDDAIRLVDDPAVRAALSRELDDDAVALHYRAKPGAVPFSFGAGALWKIAVAWPGAPVPPCLHRAPSTEPDDEPRLLLIC